MTFILKVTNPSQELVLSSDAKGLYCIGKAVLQTLVQPTGTASGAIPGRVAGYSKYRISWPTPVVFAVDLPLNKRVGITNVTQPSVGVWEVTCYCGDTADSYGFDSNQYQLDVWAYGLPQTPMTGMVFQILNQYDGSVSYDLTRPNPLFPRAYANPAARGSGMTIPSLSRPVVLGCPTTTSAGDNFMSTNHYSFDSTRSMWRRTSTTTVVEETVWLQRYEYNATQPNGNGAGYEPHSSPCFIIEGATLP